MEEYLPQLSAMIPYQQDPNIRIALFTPGDTILSLCETSKFYADLCRNEVFWHDKFMLDFPEDIANFKPEGMTWKSYYIQALNLRPKPVFYHQQKIGYVWLRPTNTNKEAYEKSLQLFISKHPEVDLKDIRLGRINIHGGMFPHYTVSRMNAHPEIPIFSNLVTAPGLDTISLWDSAGLFIIDIDRT